jgi:hypothetical protein
VSDSDVDTQVAVITKSLFKKYHDEFILPHLRRKSSSGGGFNTLFIRTDDDEYTTIDTSESKSLWVDAINGASLVDGGENTIYLSIRPFGGADADYSGTPGGVPTPYAGDHEKFLRGDATWATLPTMVGSGPNAAGGLVPKPPLTAGTTKFLCEDGTWRDPLNPNNS